MKVAATATFRGIDRVRCNTKFAAGAEKGV